MDDSVSDAREANRNNIVASRKEDLAWTQDTFHRKLAYGIFHND